MIKKISKGITGNNAIVADQIIFFEWNYMADAEQWND